MAGIGAGIAGLGLKAIAGSALTKAGDGIAAGFKWLGSLDAIHTLLLMLALFGAWQTFGRWSQHRHEVKIEAQLASCTKARAADAAAYAKAQSDAAAKNMATVAADKAERERITNDVSQSYQAQLAALRADLANRLRSQAGAPSGAASPAGLPSVSIAPSGPDDASRVSIPSSLYVHGAELELQLERLQQWIDQQMKVDPNKEATRP